jgi:enamine deaminase RidA (YjgF/YER057c/UK114 family)
LKAEHRALKRAHGQSAALAHPESVLRGPGPGRAPVFRHTAGAGPGGRAGLSAVDANACSTSLRRFAGPHADELAILCRLTAGTPGRVRQAEAAYRALARVLAAHQGSFRDLTRETVFLRAVRRDLPQVLGARRRVLTDVGQSAGAPLPAFIQQAPVDEGASLELSAWAVIPHRRDAWSVHDVRAVPACACDGCARSGARLVCLPARRTEQPAATQREAAPPEGRRAQTQTSLYTSNIYGRGDGAFEQAWDMFCAAERLLEQCGMGFCNVVRTWIYLRDINRDYGALNKARREFFRRRGIELRPASTGVQGIPFPDTHDFSMTLHAVTCPQPLDVTLMSTPLLSQAWSYGVDFSRGLRLAEANKVTLHVSGTASIDEAGRTVHVGDFAAQADRMLDNIASLLAEQGATLADLVSGVVYLKHSADAPLLRSRLRRRGCDGFPCALVEAPLCRPELLCETEAVAILSPRARA